MNDFLSHVIRVLELNFACEILFATTPDFPPRDRPAAFFARDSFL